MRRTLATLLGAALIVSIDTARPIDLMAQPSASPLTLSFGGVTVMHRWSEGNLHEFTPKGQEDLSKWREMVSLNVHPEARTGEQLAEVANRVLSNYQQYGKILRTDSKPRTAKTEAEHLLAAILINPQFLEAAFARILLHDGEGLVVVYSKRVLGAKAGNEMSGWLEKNGPSTEDTLMAWTGLPPMAQIKSLR